MIFAIIELVARVDCPHFCVGLFDNLIANQVSLFVKSGKFFALVHFRRRVTNLDRLTQHNFLFAKLIGGGDGNRLVTDGAGRNPIALEMAKAVGAG